MKTAGLISLDAADDENGIAAFSTTKLVQRESQRRITGLGTRSEQKNAQQGTGKEAFHGGSQFDVPGFKAHP